MSALLEVLLLILGNIFDVGLSEQLGHKKVKP